MVMMSLVQDINKNDKVTTIKLSTVAEMTVQRSRRLNIFVRGPQELLNGLNGFVGPYRRVTSLYDLYSTSTVLEMTLLELPNT